MTVDPLTGERERQSPEPSVVGGIDQQARQPGKRHQQGVGAMQKNGIQD
jgi:hypothetical protein